MGQASAFYATFLIPAAVAGFTYVLLSFVVVPLWQRYKNRYSRYLPVDTISSTGRTVRDRIADFVAKWLVPSRWREHLQAAELSSPWDGFVLAETGRGSDSDAEELQHIDARRREALSLDAARQDSNRRLSRDLEEGFATDSDDESAGGRTRRR